ncbi:MAG: hypothetical protein HC830_08365 [Bacteroidetes bacterium]|nr:hypothetical protein [Bacteroidota bacterium]
MINQYNIFASKGYYGYWWSATEKEDKTANYWQMVYSNSEVSNSVSLKNYGFSIRCIKD